MSEGGFSVQTFLGLEVLWTQKYFPCIFGSGITIQL